MTDFVRDLLRRRLDHVLVQEPVPDDAEEMNWRLFFAHSQDMQGFAADIFVGGPNERKHPTDPSYRGLRERWQLGSGKLIDDLAAVWNDSSFQKTLVRLTNPKQKGAGVDAGIRILMDASTNGATAFAECLSDLSGPRISRKTNKMIRAYLQNSYLLTRHERSFRCYLQNKSSMASFPSSVTPSEEAAWRRHIEHDFFNVGPAIANYLISDWLLWLWKEGRIEWFESYKADTVHEAFVQSGKLPKAAVHDFIAFCRTLSIPDGHGALSGKPCPPRVLNACLWQEGNRSSGDPKSRIQSGPAPKQQSARSGSCPVPTAGSGAVSRFKDDDVGYRQWLSNHTDGYVLNTERNPGRSYLRLHQATCHFIVDPIRKGQALTRDYIKFCAARRAPLEDWCEATFGAGPETGCYCLARA